MFVHFFATTCCGPRYHKLYLMCLPVQELASPSLFFSILVQLTMSYIFMLKPKLPPWIVQYTNFLDTSIGAIKWCWADFVISAFRILHYTGHFVTSIVTL